MTCKTCGGDLIVETKNLIPGVRWTTTTCTVCGAVHGEVVAEKQEPDLRAVSMK